MLPCVLLHPRQNLRVRLQRECEPARWGPVAPMDGDEESREAGASVNATVETRQVSLGRLGNSTEPPYPDPRAGSSSRSPSKAGRRIQAVATPGTPCPSNRRALSAPCRLPYPLGSFFPPLATKLMQSPWFLKVVP